MINQPVGLVRGLPSQDVSHLLGVGVNMDAKRLAYEKASGALLDGGWGWEWDSVPAASTMHVCNLFYRPDVYACAERMSHDLDHVGG